MNPKKVLRSRSDRAEAANSEGRAGATNRASPTDPFAAPTDPGSGNPRQRARPQRDDPNDDAETPGSGGTGTSVLGNAVGDIGGEESHTQLINELVSHTHSVGTSPDGAVLNNAGYGTFSPSGTFNTGSSGGGDPFNIIQPSAVVLKIIKT